MAQNDARTEPTLTTVLSGIVTDVQKLMSQQTDLLRAEVVQNWRKATRAMQPLVAGALLTVTGVVLLGNAAALLLHWSVSPVVVDAARMPLWACFGIASLAFLVVGGALVGIGVKRLEEVDAVPKATVAEFEKSAAAVVDTLGHPAAT